MPNCVVILAGGKGSRMKSECPKPLIKLSEHSLIEHVLLSIMSIKNADIEDIIVISDKYNYETYKKLIGVTKVVIQHKTCGTFNALEQSFPFIKSYNKVLIIPSDKPFIDPFVLANMLQKKGNCILGYKAINNKQVLVTDNDNCLLRIVEDIDETIDYNKEQYHTAGVYCLLTSEIVKLKSDVDIKPNNIQKEYYLTDIFPLLQTKTEIVEVNEKIAANINTQADLQKGKEILSKNTNYNIDISEKIHGRLNLMGRHIDHQGGCCNIILLPQSVKCELRWLKCYCPLLIITSNYGTVCFDLRNLCLDNNWTKYVVAPFIYLQYKLKTKYSFPIQIHVSGNIPQGAGLSSSSAVVVSVMKCLTRMLNYEINKYDLCKYCGEAERLIGSNGGLGDQAAMIFGSLDKITKIKLIPELLVEDGIDKPSNLVVYIYNSGVVAEKGFGQCTKKFNDKVLCYKEGLDKIGIKYIDELTTDKVKMLKNSNVTDEVIDVVTYGYNEYQRSNKFIQYILDGNMYQIGECVKNSMLDEQLLYKCSSDEIDKMVKTANDINGVLGTQICGAGMGGCVAIFCEPYAKVKEVFDENYEFVCEV